MVSTRFLGVLSTSMLVVGALSIGQALHLSVVTGQVALTSTPVVVYGVAGVVAITIGYRARRPVAESYALTSDARERGEHEHPSGQSTDRAGDAGNEGTAEGSSDGAASFDPAMSPLGDAEPGESDRMRREGSGASDGEDARERTDT